MNPIHTHWSVQPDPNIHPDWQHLANQVVSVDHIICRVSDGLPVEVARLISLAPAMYELLQTIAKSNSGFSDAAYTIVNSMTVRKPEPEGYVYTCGDVQQTNLFWMCACEGKHIHPHTEIYCSSCLSWAIWSEDALVEDVLDNRNALPAKLVAQIETALGIGSEMVIITDHF